jgi:hypothetical protein
MDDGQFEWFGNQDEDDMDQDVDNENDEDDYDLAAENRDPRTKKDRTE